MKKNLGTLITLALFALVTVTANAQKAETSETSKPKWISKHGYWVIENNINTPKSSTIFFYNNNNTLVYTEKVEGVKLNINRRKTLMKLKEVLDESLIAWTQQQSLKNEQLVKSIFKTDH